MNARIKARWLKALRSGKYRQGTGALKRTDSATGEVQHCCLGVLCELAVRSKVIAPATNDAVFGESRFDGVFAVLPSSVRDWAGLEHRDPQVRIRTEYARLSDLNDGGKSFKQIANIIERQL